MANKGASSNKRRNRGIKSSKIREYTENLASLESANVIDAARLSALAEMTQKQSDKLMAVVAQEESQVQEQLKNAYLEKDSSIQVAIQEYTQELSKLYYDSSSISADDITEGSLPTLDVIVKTIDTDPIFDTDKLQPAKIALLNYAKKIKTQLESRTSLEGRLKNSLSKLIGSDVVMGALAGAATKSPLIALSMFAFGQSKKKNNYAAKYAAKEKQLSLAKNQAGRQQSNTALPSNEAPPANSDAISSISEPPQATGTASPFKGILGATGNYAVAPDAASSTKTGGGSEIVKILIQHTSLLQSIYNVNSKSLKIQETQLAKQIAAAEENNLESQNGGAGNTSTASKLRKTQKNTTADETNNEDDSGGGPALDAWDLFRRRPRSPRAPRRPRAPRGGRFGRFLNRIPGGRGAGGLLTRASSLASKGGILGGAARLFGGAGKLAGAARFLSPLARVAGKVALPLAIGMSAYDAYKGWNADSSLSAGGKALNAGKSILSGLTFGLSDYVTGGVSYGEKPTPQISPAPTTPTTTAPSAPTSPPPAPTPTATPTTTGFGGGKSGGAGASASFNAPTATKTSTLPMTDIKKMIIDHEGIRYQPYKDSLGLWTVGVGHLIGNGKTLPPEMNRTFSHNEVMSMFDEDYVHHEKAAQKIPGYDKFNKMGQGALVDLTFNMGPAWIKKFPNTAKAIAAGNAQAAASGLENSLWYRQVGRRGKRIVEMIRQGAGDVSTTTTAGGGAAVDTAAAKEISAASVVGENRGQASAPTSSSMPGTAAPAGDTTAQGRATVSGGLTAPVAPTSVGGSTTNIVQGGNTMMGGGGGGGSAGQIIPAPIDREPTIRRILDGSLS